MKLRTWLLLSLAACLAVSTAALTVLVDAARDTGRAGLAQSRAQTVTHQASGLLVLAHEFVQHAEERAAQQWQERHQAIVALLPEERADEDASLRELRSLAQDLPDLFRKLQQVNRKDTAFEQRRRQLLLDQLVGSNQALSDHAYQWYHEAVAARDAAERRFQAWAIATPLVLLAALMLLAVVVHRRVLRPLGLLHAAAVAVAKGDLTVKLALRQSDELGEVAHRFDEMTRELAARTAAQARSEEQVRSILTHAPDAFVGIDQRSRITEWNRQAEVVFGWRRDEVLGRSMAEVLIPPHQRAMHDAGFARFVKTGQGAVVNQRIELMALRRDGDPLPIELSVGAVRDGDAWVAHAFLRDITERRRAETALKASEQRLRQIADNVPVLISFVDAQHRLQFANGMFRHWLSMGAAEVRDLAVRDVFGEALYTAGAVYIDRALGGERVEFESTHEVDGQPRVAHTIFIPQQSDDGIVRGIYTLSTDITAVKQAERQLRALARVDALTGLANRLQFDELLPQAISRARRSSKGMALLFLDVDHFKQINDTWGHAGGDTVLKVFATRLKATVRTTDHAARLAGDEFVVILEGLNRAEEATLVADKIVRSIGQPIDLEGRPLHVTTSVGCAYHHPEAGETTPQALFVEADAALYEAKKAGRNTYRLAA